MSEFNASDPKALRRAAKAAKLAEQERHGVVLGLMSTPAGRAYINDLLVRCHIFASSFSISPTTTAFAEGERNVGLQLLNDIMRFAPDQYVQMMREATDKEQINGRRTERSNTDGHERDRTDNGWDVGGSVESDYEPTDGLDTDSAVH